MALALSLPTAKRFNCGLLLAVALKAVRLGLRLPHKLVDS